MNAFYGTMASTTTTTSSASSDIDIEALEDNEAQPEQQRHRRGRGLFQNSMLPSYQPVITNISVDTNDEDESSSSLGGGSIQRRSAADVDATMTSPAEFSTATIRTPCSCSNIIYKTFILLIAMTCFILLTADVFQRFGWRPPAVLLSTLNHPQQQEQQQQQQQHQHQERWVPMADILHDSGIPELKFMDNKNNNMGGLQGLALDPNNSTVLYEFHTMGVRVLQLSPRRRRNSTDDRIIQVIGIEKSRVYNGTMDFPLIFNQHVAHIGGIDVAISPTHGTEIWIATHSNGINGEGALWAVDPMTLDVKPNRDVRVNYNLDWVAFGNGILYFGGFFNVTSIKRVAIDTLEPLDDLVLSSLPSPDQDDDDDNGLDYIQSAAFDHKGRLVLLADDYQCTIYILDPHTGVLLGTQGLLLGSETDGITFDVNHHGDEGGGGEGGIMLVGFNREHSHEQVMGQEPMISIIQLDLLVV